MKPAPFYLLPAILLLTMLACSNNDEPIIDEALLDIVWRADSLQTPDTSLVMNPDESLTIRFDDQNVGGGTFCVRYWGDYKIAEIGSLVISDLELVALAIPCYGREFLLIITCIQVLENITSYELEENTLSLYDQNRHYVVYYSLESVVDQ